MKPILLKMASLVLVVMAFGAWPLVIPEASHAQVVCSTAGTGDADADGFTDAQECAGITTIGTSPLLVPPCTGVAGENRNTCMNPNSKDAFVILVKATPTSLFDTILAGQDPLAILKTTGTGALGIAVHGLTPAQARIDITNFVPGPSDRLVTATQKAIRITESVDASDIVTGICNQGTPNGLDGCVVYTQRIANLVNSKCPAGKTCLLSGVSGGQPVNTVITRYIQNTIAHEASHSMALTKDYNSRYGGNHYKTGTNVVMDQSVYYNAGNTSTTFTIPGLYATADPPAAKLK